MLDNTIFRKNKIELFEYDYSKDIENRILMAQFSQLDLEILEEILYSSLNVPISLLGKNLDLPISDLFPILKKLSQTKLFFIVSDHIVVEKEMRKYYEFQILKFEEEFKPGMEYLQGLLRKVPIHVLPNWYSIPRTSNNIFESIVEKYLLTPQVFQRYLLSLLYSDPIQEKIMQDVYHSSGYEIDAAYIIEKFDLTKEEFDKHMLFLEFSFACCTKYKREGNHFKEVITLFHEWREYLNHISRTEIDRIIDEEKIVRKKSRDFAFIEEMSTILELAKKKPLSKQKNPFDPIVKKQNEFSEKDYGILMNKLCDLELAQIKNDKLVCLENANEWLQLKINDRAIYIYRSPLNSFPFDSFPRELQNERSLREAEKSICRVIHSGWVFLDDFLQGIYTALHEDQSIQLKRIGKTWKYELPQYSQPELLFFKTVITQWFFQLGITALGKKQGRECFCITPFGQDLFGNE